MVSWVVGLGLAGVVSVTSGAPISSPSSVMTSTEMTSTLPSPSSVMTSSKVTSVLPSSVMTSSKVTSVLPSSVMTSSKVTSVLPSSSALPLPAILRCPRDYKSKIGWLYPYPNTVGDTHSYYECDTGVPTLGRCDFDLDVANGKCSYPEGFVKLTCPPNWESKLEWRYPNPMDMPQGYFECVNGIPVEGRCDFELDVANGKCSNPEGFVELTCPPNWESKLEWRYPNPMDMPQGYFECVNGIPVEGRCDFELDVANGKCSNPEGFVELTCPPNWESKLKWRYPNPMDMPQGYFECVNGIPVEGRCDFEFDVANGKCSNPEGFVEFTCPPNWESRIGWRYPNPMDMPQGYFECVDGIPLEGRCDFDLDMLNGKCSASEGDLELTCPPDWESQIGARYPNPLNAGQSYFECVDGVAVEGFCNYFFDEGTGECYDPEDDNYDPEDDSYDSENNSSMEDIDL